MSSSILATCKQTRFHLLDEKPAQEVPPGPIDVDGLNISVISTSESTDASSKQPKPKNKSKAKAEARELIVDAHLRLKAGVHYGFIGRNGTGKSTLLRAMAEKLIPGIPHATRIAILQQTDTDAKTGEGDHGTSDPADGNQNTTVLQQVMGSDRSRNEVIQKMEFLSKSFETEDPSQPVHAIRTIRHEQAEKHLFLAQKNASLKSGARGLQARKDLRAAEDKLQASKEILNQPKDTIGAEATKADTQAAMDMLQDLQSQFEAMKLVDIEQQARQILTGLGFKGDWFAKPVNTLSGGWHMRCMLASVLIQSPEVMILDEPTNFLDLLGVVWLQTYLQQLRESSQTTIVLVSHDRDFVNAICEELVILRDQKFSYFRGNLSAFEQDFEEQKLYWGRMKEAQDRQIAHMEASIRENMKIGKKTNDDNKLRMAKSRQKKVDDRMGIQVNAKGGRFKLNRDLAGYHTRARADIEVPTDERGASMMLPDASELRFPGPLISLEGIVFQYGSQEKPVLNDIDFVMHMGDRVGVMGLNGSGKSTLVRILTGGVLPTKGKVSTHSRLKFGYYAQHSIEELYEQGQAEAGLTALGLMMREVDGTLDEGETRGLLSAMGLQGRIVSDVSIHRLSGGQLVRLALARVVWNSPHLLILDEITTHLDFHTVTALTSALSSFNGAVLLVSHDRFLIRSVIEGKRDEEHTLNDDFEGAEDEQEEEKNRRRVVYVMKAGKLNEQQNGVEQFAESLVKRAQKMLPTPG